MNSPMIFGIYQFVVYSYHSHTARFHTLYVIACIITFRF